MSQGLPAAALASPWHAMHEARRTRLAEGYDALYTSLAPVSNAIQPLSALHWVRDLGVHGAALDVGCGDGRNSLALARLGFSVTAIDLSPVGVAKLQRAAETERLAIRTDVSDVQTFGFVEAYDVIVVAYMLHHLTRDAAWKVLRRLKSHTSPGGVHLIAMFNHGGSFEELDPEAGAFYPTGEEIEALYGDWRALQHDHVHEDTLKATRSDSTDYSIFVVQRPDSPPYPRPITPAADARKEDLP